MMLTGEFWSLVHNRPTQQTLFSLHGFDSKRKGNRSLCGDGAPMQTQVYTNNAEIKSSGPRAGKVAAMLH